MNVSPTGRFFILRIMLADVALGAWTAFWLTAFFSLALMLVAAKVHGRQIRLERELEGYMTVDFRADNPPWVEALWRRDRIAYWIVYAVAAGACLLVFGGLFAVDRESQVAAWWGIPESAALTWSTLAVALLPWSLTIAFVVNAATSLRRFRRALAEPRDGMPRRVQVQRDRREWYSEARRGTRIWLGILGAGLLLVLAAILSPLL